MAQTIYSNNKKIVIQDIDANSRYIIYHDIKNNKSVDLELRYDRLNTIFNHDRLNIQDIVEHLKKLNIKVVYNEKDIY